MSWPITAADVRNALGYSATDGDQTELQLYADAAMERIEEEVGPMRGQTFSSSVAGPTDTLLLDEQYAAATVTVDGVTTAWTGDLRTGIIRGRFTGTSITVLGTATAAAPALVQVCAQELAAIWYRQAKAGAAGRSNRGAAVGPFVPLGFAIPREISEKLEPLAAKRLPGFA